MTPTPTPQNSASSDVLLQPNQRLAPAYPLVTHAPYFSIWSFSDKINESTTRHWSGKPHALSGLIRVDGKNYLYLGHLLPGIDPGEVLTAVQTSVKLTATKTIYTLVCRSEERRGGEK